jgi:NAD(P)-dependent dehydrogenase (short-subunit alcohol dehydrogenase family)
MMERHSGRIIATGSIIVDTGNFGRNMYAVCTASKGGIVAMVKPLAVEAAPYGITVNAVSPGYIATDMMHEIDAAGREAVQRIIPAGRYGTPEEVAAAMVLASEKRPISPGKCPRQWWHGDGSILRAKGAACTSGHSLPLGVRGQARL